MRLPLATVSQILLSPWAAMIALAIGGIIGIEFETLSAVIAPFGDIYIALLKMCVLPLTISALIAGFANFMRADDFRQKFGSLFFYYIVFMLGASFLGFIIALVSGTGDLDEASKSILGQFFLSFQDSQSATAEASKGWGIINQLIPDNFFNALSSGRMLEIVFFSILLGTALGLVKSPTTKVVINIFETTFEALQRIIKWIFHGLPFGILCIVAHQVSISKFETIMSLIKYISFFIIGVIVIFIGLVMLISIVLKRSPLLIISDIQETLLIAIGTQSFYPVIPQLIENLTKNFNLHTTSVNLIVPLGMMINRQGIAFVFAFTTVTVAQMYDISLGLTDIVFLVVGICFVSMAANNTLVTSATLISLILDPLGLPSSAAIVFLTTAAPILTPLALVISALGTTAIATLMLHKNVDEVETIPPPVQKVNEGASPQP